MSETTCPACNKKLASLSGYNQHLSKTTNPACHDLYIRSRQFHANPPTRVPQDEDQDMDIGDASDPDHLPLEFEGDFFGTYAENELEWPDDGGAMGDPPTDEEDLGDDGAHDEWEPPLVPSAHNPHEGDDEDNDIRDQHTPDAQDPRYGVEERLRSHEDAPIVVQYPDQRAGQPINPTKQSSNATYHTQLIGSDPNNVYAPFTSKLDWEMARWAKLRGPSSTAFSELVSIEGVSFWFILKLRGLV